VVVGEKDGLTPPARVRELAALVQGSTLREIPGAAHLPNLERPEAFNAAVQAWLSTIPPASLSG